MEHKQEGQRCRINWQQQMLGRTTGCLVRDRWEDHHSHTGGERGCPFGGKHVCIENVIKLICDIKVLIGVGFSKMN